MKVIRRVTILAAGLAILPGFLDSVHAFCDNARLIDGCAGGTCQYIQSPGAKAFKGSFWGFGGGNPTVGAGDDNGSLLAVGNGNPNNDWVYSNSGNYYIAGIWSVTGVDGCVDNNTTPFPKRTVIALSDADPPGDTSKAYFGLVCKEQDANGNYPVSLLGPPQLVQIPYPHLLASSRSPGVSVTGTFRRASANISGGTLADASCGPLLRGYKLYTQVRPNGAGQPGNRDRASGWTAAPTGEIAIDQDSPPLTVSCSQSTSVYVAMSLVFESGFETAHVSQQVRIACDPTLSDRPGNFKLIKRPRDRERR